MSEEIRKQENELNEAELEGVSGGAMNPNVEVNAFELIKNPKVDSAKQSANQLRIGLDSVEKDRFF